jgi:hypothetical protein
MRLPQPCDFVPAKLYGEQLSAASSGADKASFAEKCEVSANRMLTLFLKAVLGLSYCPYLRERQLLVLKHG